MAGSTLPERVAQIYYSYGLFCSSYPITAITLALTVVLLCCYPLLNVPLPGNIPTVVKLEVPRSLQSGTGNPIEQAGTERKHMAVDQDDDYIRLKQLLNETQKLPYLWAKESPFLYAQQIILKSGVFPWNSNLRMWDAFRGPIQETFRLLETIRNHEDPYTKTTLARYCYQIDSIQRRDSKAGVEHVLPEYSCLMLSPANLWQQNPQTYSLDNNIISTIFSYQNPHRGKVSIAEMVFGMHLKDAGIKRYPLWSRPRVLQYAVTIFYEQADERFINSLNKKLREVYPLHQNSQYIAEDAAVIYYPGNFNYHELVPLAITFFGLFIYIYFSVRKIEFIKSKFGLAACAVVTIGASLTMSMGLCFYFGFTLSLQGKEIFPYLVIIIGLENVLVLTKSVISTDSRLDVKIRLAQGLSKEGWSITKNLLIEITIFTVGFFTFVPFIQEVSIFMIISLVSDYFIQMVFFATILGIDVRHMEYFQEKNNNLHLKSYFNSDNALNWQFNRHYLQDKNLTPQRMTKSKSHPRLNGLVPQPNCPTDVVAKRKSMSGNDNKVPKRIRLVNMWARTRFFQRAFMIWMLVWISMIVYNSGVIEYFVGGIQKTDNTTEYGTKDFNKREYRSPGYKFFNHSATDSTVFSPVINLGDNEKSMPDINDSILLKHTQHLRPWTKLPPYHWSAILAQYNESISGRYIMILPPLLLSCRISPELAISVHNPDEKDPQPLRWQALAAALDPIDIVPDFDFMDGISETNPWGSVVSASELPIYPTTPMEILLLTILCIISVIVIAYMMVVLYRCICSRNYAEWRASWSENDEYLKIIGKQPAVQLVMEAVPLVVSGHNHEVECVVTDGEKIVSSCLQGTLKVWDSQNGEQLNKIDRQAYFNFQKELYERVHMKKAISSKNDEGNKTLTPSDFEQNYQAKSTLRQRKEPYNFKFESQGLETQTPLPTAELIKYELAKWNREVNYYCQFAEEYGSYEVKENIDINNKSNETNNKDSVTKIHSDNTFIEDTNESDINVLKDRIKNNSILNLTNVNAAKPDYVSNLDWQGQVIVESPIWSMDYCNELVIVGCADGRLEFWEVTTGKLMCIWWSTHGERGSRGVTHVHAVGSTRRVCVGTLSGHLILLRLDAYNPMSGVHVDWSFSTAHRRTHKRTGSAGSIRTHHYNVDNTPYEVEQHRAENLTSFTFDDDPQRSSNEEIHCSRIAYCRAHQQPITEMQSEGGRILTGGQDHVLKVFSSTDLKQLFTLHGHCGPITSCFIDHFTPTIGGSGSQDGLLCVWDLHTGACLYSTQAHDGALTSLAYTASYVISAGADEKLCIWDRFQGHMLNSIHIGLNYMSRMLPLTHTLLLMGDRSGLTVYDLSNGDVIRRVLFGQSDGCIFVRQILPLKDAVVCDYANQLRIVRFPLVANVSNLKME